MRDWFVVNWLALLALLVALTSLFFAYGAYRHVAGASTLAAMTAPERAAALPKLTFLTGEDGNAGQAGIALKNGGPGLAIIKSVDYFIDGRRMADEEAVIGIAPRGAREALQYTHLDPGARIGANTDKWLLFLSKRDTRAQVYESLAAFMSDSVAVGVRYCSEQNECADTCSKVGGCTAQK